MKNTLAQGDAGMAYTITAINTAGDDEMEKFLLSLGCYPGQQVTIVSKLNQNLVITIKDARYSIDETLALAISI